MTASLQLLRERRGFQPRLVVQRRAADLAEFFDQTGCTLVRQLSTAGHRLFVSGQIFQGCIDHEDLLEEGDHFLHGSVLGFTEIQNDYCSAHQNSCTKSVTALTTSGSVPGSRPWPQLNMWPGR